MNTCGIRPAAGRVSAFHVLAAVVALVAVALAPGTAALASPAVVTSAAAGAPRRALRAVRVSRPPKMDGRLDDPEWKKAPVATGFVQQVPNLGAKPSFRTEVRILYTDSHLYVGARMFDPQPKRIERALVRRDTTTTQADQFEVELDPYHDRRTGEVFKISAAGVQWDEYLYADTGGDPDWNAVWRSRVHVDSKGWTAEIAIPFSQLNFSAGITTWGLELRRYVARKGEYDEWQRIPPTGAVRVSAWGLLEGLDHLSPPNTLQVTPYVSGGGRFYPATDPKDPFATGHDLLLNAGGDLTYALGPNWKVDATVNPDFGQVEADPAQVNLDAVPLYLTERRPFFLQGVQIFDTGGAAALFYSRRIGGPALGVARDPAHYAYVSTPGATPIYGAAKITGRTRGGTTVGVLEAVTAPVSNRYVDAKGAPVPSSPDFEVQPLTNDLMVRAQQDFDHGDSQVGVTGTSVNRALTGNLAGQLTRDAYAGGVDWNLGIQHKRYYLSGQLLGSYVRGSPAVMTALQEDFSRYAQRPDASYLHVDPKATSLTGLSGSFDFGTETNRKFNYDLHAAFTTPMFEVNDLGYEGRADAMSLYAEGYGQNMAAKGMLQQWQLGAILYAQENFGQDLIGGQLTVFGSLLTRGFVPMNFQLSVAPPTADDRLLRGGPLASTPALVSWYAEISTDTRRAVTLDLSTNGDETALGTYSANFYASLQAQPLPALSVSLGPSLSLRKNDAQYVDAYPDPAATSTYGTRYVFAGIHQVVSAVDLRVNWTFSPNLSFQSYLRGTVVTGAYRGLEYFLRPGYRDFAPFAGATGTTRTTNGVVTVQAAGSTAKDVFPTPSFTFTGLQANVVLRWQYRPGSTLFFVYQFGCGAGVADAGSYRLGTWGNLCNGGPPEHTVMVKASYWLGD